MPRLACWTCITLFYKPPENGSPLPKHAEFGTFQELYFIKGIYWLQYWNSMHSISNWGEGKEEEEEPMRFWIHIYHVSIFVQRKLEFLISMFIGCIVFCNLMPVFHEDLHAKLLFYFRSVLLSMFKLECEQTVCWTSIKKPKQNTIFLQRHSMCFFDNQLCQYEIKLHNLFRITYLNMLSKQSVKAVLVT